MKTVDPIKPFRKPPKQARSRALVETILEGAARVLITEGLNDFNTNKVAEVAGVSVGSLYQYFPDKRAILAALFKKYFDEILAILDASQISGQNLEADLTQIIYSAIQAHRHTPDLHRHLTSCVHELEPYVDMTSVQTEVSSRLEKLLGRYRDRVSPEQIPYAAFVIERTIEGVVHGAVMDRPEFLSKNLARDLVQMIGQFLTHTP